MAICLKHERYEVASFLLNEQYFVPNVSDPRQETMKSFTVFNHNLQSINDQSERTKRRTLSVHSDLLDLRCNILGIDLRQLQQADFVAFQRSEMIHDRESYWNWFPNTLLFIGHNGPFEIFAKSSSCKYFNKVKVLFGIDAKDQLKPLLDSYDRAEKHIPTWHNENQHSWQQPTFSPSYLLGYEKLCTRP